MSRILSIEDDPDCQHLISLAFQNAGYEVHYAFTGKEGYEKVLTLNPDLILTDMMLPLISGLEVIKLIKQHKKARDTPIIVLTAYPTDANFLENSIKAIGVLEYIRKPVEMEELLRVVRRVLGNRSSGTDVGSSANLKLRKGAVRIDPKFRAVWINNKLAATLPPKRFEILFILIQNKGEVRWQELVKNIWGIEGTKNDLEKTIQRLREDLGAGESCRIKTTPNGYELTD